MFDEIVRATIAEFDENGIRFTMDDLAKRMRISKRTLYSHIESKEKLILDIIELNFRSIKEQEKKIMENDGLDIMEKLRNVLSIMPFSNVPIDYRRIHEIKEFYPKLYERIEYHLSTEWENTLYLIQEGVRMKRLKPV
ncbi:MAG: TetR/AcrR family transcriptional regulator, partial [Pseudomonadota bacterium]